ncbi:YceI family protein [Actinotalea sp. BY-33]|uniref:YceI family protein n=1 Tax=Actinotalea soli TaxID=2819234 RepID=A0A939LTV4_9CELL|nr:YceI family protein [Actinotalea soli]MBO1752580.1 YceI family protein [Actinotalea soli]
MKKKLIIALVAVLAIAGVVLGGTAIYASIQNDRAPEELALSEQDDAADGADGGGSDEAAAAADETTPPTEAGDLAGTWTVAEGSQAGYRVDEVLNGQDVTVVGRTEDVEGEVVIDGTDLAAADVTVSMTTITTDSSSRDGQFLSILRTAEFPTATFTLTEPVDISAIAGGSTSVQAEGELTIAGETAPVVVDLEAQTTASGVEVSGTIPVTFADYGVEAPDLGFVKVEDTGTVEMLLQLTR